MESDVTEHKVTSLTRKWHYWAKRVIGAKSEITEQKMMSVRRKWHHWEENGLQWVQYLVEHRNSLAATDRRENMHIFIFSRYEPAEQSSWECPVMMGRQINCLQRAHLAHRPLVWQPGLAIVVPSPRHMNCISAQTYAHGKRRLKVISCLVPLYVDYYSGERVE